MAESVINLRCVMRAIVAINLILLMMVGCESNHSKCDDVVGDISIAYLCSLAEGRSERIGGDIWIEGYVVLNDKLKESYRSFVLHDGTAGITVELDADDVDMLVPLYSHVRIRCEGLYVGREGTRYVLGAEPTAQYVVDRIAEHEVVNRFSVDYAVDSFPDAKVVRVADIGDDDMLDYVRVDGVILVDGERGALWCDADAKYRPFDSSLRHFAIGADTLTVATLNRCHYGVERISDEVISLIGIVDSYRGEVVLRLSDRKMFVPAL